MGQHKKDEERVHASHDLILSVRIASSSFIVNHFESIHIVFKQSQMSDTCAVGQLSRSLEWQLMTKHCGPPSPLWRPTGVLVGKLGFESRLKLSFADKVAI